MAVISREEIAQPIRDQIMSGELRPGDRVPSVRELAQQTGASRVTAGEALRLLAGEGFLTLQQKKTAIVRSRNAQDFTASTRIADARAELADLQSDLKAAQQSLAAIAAKLSATLRKLD